MERKYFYTGRRNAGFFAGVVLVSLLLAGDNTWATTHIVQFGGSFGFTYSPSSFSAKVGDTVTWQGDFTMHPLSSTTIPATAQSWHNGSGSSFSYRIAVAGTYNYHCDVHFSLGMVGSFTASPSAVIYSAPKQSADRNALITGTTSGKSFIRFTVPDARQVSLSVMDLQGRTLATIVGRTLPAGTYREPLDGAIMARGIYFVNLRGVGTGGREVLRFLK
jgi:plastocyanin